MVSPIERFSRRLAGLEDQVRGLSRTPQLAYSSIENGSVDEYDADGNLAAVIGKQFDGSHGAYPVTGPAPPTPSLPAVSGGISLNIGWDGMFTGPDGQTDATIPAPMDFTRVEVHASRETGFVADSADTLIDTIESPRGGVRPALLGAGTWFVVLVSRSASGKRSEQSAEASAVVRPPVTAEEVQDLQDALDGKTTTITSTAEPSGDAAAGTVWQQEDADHNIIGMWRYEGGTTPWQRVLFGDAMLGDVTASKVTAGMSGGGRVQIDETGLRGWDAANVQYLKAGATGLEMTGTLVNQDIAPHPMNPARQFKRSVSVGRREVIPGTGTQQPGLWFDDSEVGGTEPPLQIPSGLYSLGGSSSQAGLFMRSGRRTEDEPWSCLNVNSYGASITRYSGNGDTTSDLSLGDAGFFALRSHAGTKASAIVRSDPARGGLDLFGAAGVAVSSDADTTVSGNTGVALSSPSGPARIQGTSIDLDTTGQVNLGRAGSTVRAPGAIEVAGQLRAPGGLTVEGADYGASQRRVQPALNAGWSQWTNASWNGIWIEQMGKLTIISGAVGKGTWAEGETIANLPARYRPANKAAGTNCEVQPNGNLNIGPAGKTAAVLSITYFSA